MIKLSIIIPIYKVEDYIVECIESVCNQLVDGVEVILVNDGTPDRSIIIVKEYINEKYSQYLKQFVFIDQDNQGQSIARNNALDIARGEYIGFLDSDDTLDDKYFEVILSSINFNPDIIRFGAKEFCESKLKSKKFLSFTDNNKLITNSRDILNEIFNQCAWFPWLNVYKKDFFLYTKFPEGMYFEDAWLMPQIFSKVKNILFIKDSLYLYRKNLGSSLNNKNLDNIKKLDESFKKIIAEYRQRVQLNSLYTKGYISFLMSYSSFLISNNSIFEAYTVSKLRKTKGVDFAMLTRSSKFFYIFGFVFILFYKFIGKM